jgi:hypothetical protein
MHDLDSNPAIETRRESGYPATCRNGPAVMLFTVAGSTCVPVQGRLMRDVRHPDPLLALGSRDSSARYQLQDLPPAQARQRRRSVPGAADE